MIIPHSRPTIDNEDIEAVDHVLASGKISQGVNVEEFECAVAEFVGVKHGVAVSSGTAALHLALVGLNIGADDEVIMPSYVCSSPYIATLHAGATPKIVDVDLVDFNISPDEVGKNISKKTRAIIAPHMFGTPVELDEVLSYNIPIVEDCALALGSEYRGRKVGSLGRVAICSFYATKMITTGEGGMVLTNDNEIYEKVLEVRQYDKGSLDTLRYNYKMTDFQAALGISQMKKISNFIKRRKEIATLYTRNFSEFDVVLPKKYDYKQSVFYRYVVQIKNLDHVRNEMSKRGVMCEKPVFKPLNEEKTGLSLPHTEYVYNHALSIPIYPRLNDDEIRYIIDNVKLVLART